MKTIASRALAFLVWTLMVAAAGWMTGYDQRGDDCQAEIGDLKKTQSDNEAKVANAARDRLLAAQARSDEIEARLAKADADRQTQALENSREIKRLTAGRACLNAGTVRLFNEPGPRSDAAAMSAPAGEPAAADAPAASDTDVAEWIDHAKRQYDACRDRVQALIDFEAPR